MSPKADTVESGPRAGWPSGAERIATECFELDLGGRFGPCRRRERHEDTKHTKRIEWNHG